MVQGVQGGTPHRKGPQGPQPRGGPPGVSGVLQAATFPRVAAPRVPGVPGVPAARSSSGKKLHSYGNSCLETEDGERCRPGRSFGQGAEQLLA